MRDVLKAVGVTCFVLAGCCTSASTSGTTGASSTGGTTTGTTGGTTGGLLAGAPCSSNVACVSGICDVDGSGHCCAAACTIGDAGCGATACNAAGQCVYPSAGSACGSDSCSSAMLQMSSCDGSGTCAPGTPTACAGNFGCTPAGTACATACTADAGCSAGFACAASTCIDPGTCDADGGPIAVDSVTGNDATACCGVGNAQPCRTLTRAMQLVAATQIPQLHLQVTVNGAGGDWAPAAETYPIELGWGAEVSAPGVYFPGPPGGFSEIFAIGPQGPNDVAMSASLLGDPGSPIVVGSNQAGQQSAASSTIRVETGGSLYAVNAAMNGSAMQQTTAITIAPNGSVIFGKDELDQVHGTTVIGNSFAAKATDGWNGIVCEVDKVNQLGCVITDAKLTAQTSLVIQGQENLDVDVEDFSVIYLSSAPVFGVAPAGPPGFNQCPAKPDLSASNGVAVLLNGDVGATFKNAKFQCLAGTAITTDITPTGDPELNLLGTTIQNTERGVLVKAGKAHVSNSTFQFNVIGVEQINAGTIDLSGDSIGGTNTLVCSDARESVRADGGPGVSALNNGDSLLDGTNVAWDTADPDQFNCDATLTSCTCVSASCTVPPGQSGMDVVTTSHGLVDTTGHSVSPTVCNP